MYKCEWKNDCLNVCDDRARELHNNPILAEESYPYCKWCGADIRKPIPSRVHSLFDDICRAHRITR